MTEKYGVEHIKGEWQQKISRPLKVAVLRSTQKEVYTSLWCVCVYTMYFVHSKYHDLLFFSRFTKWIRKWITQFYSEIYKPEIK